MAARYSELSKESKLLVNRLYSAAREYKYGEDLMQAFVDEIAELDKKNDPEYREFLRLKEKFPDG